MSQEAERINAAHAAYRASLGQGDEAESAALAELQRVVAQVKREHETRALDEFEARHAGSSR